MAEGRPITDYLTDEEAAGLSDAAKSLTTTDLFSAMKGFQHRNMDGPPTKMTPAIDALTFEDWQTLAQALIRFGMRAHTK